MRSRSPPNPRPPTLSPRSRERRAFQTGLLASAVLHLLIIAIYPLFLGDPEARPPTGELPPPLSVVEGTEIVQIVELPETPEPSPPAPAPEEAPQTKPSDVNLTAAADDEPGEEAEEPEEEGLTLAERLQPRMIDPRLWAPVDPEYTQLSEEERAQLLLRGMIQSWIDSMAVAEAISERATDWTYTDDEGRRWGLSPGRLHLGDFSIPLPFSFALPPGRREALAEQQLIRDDLARSSATAIIRETWAQRARAIRERLEAERARPGSVRAVDNGGGGGSP